MERPSRGGEKRTAVWASHHEERGSDGAVAPPMCDHRVVLHRCVVREWCHPSGAAVAPGLHAAARTRRAARVVQGDVVSVWQVLAAPAKFEAESPLRDTAMQSLLWPEVPSLFTSNFGVAASSLGRPAPRPFLRNALPDLTTIVPVTAYYRINYVRDTVGLYVLTTLSACHGENLSGI